jgi:hypothetical protein
MAEVRRFLTLSTAHVPPGTIDRDVFNEGEIRGAILYRHAEQEGAWLWVPDDPRESALGHDDDDAPEGWLLALQLRARANRCDYVLLDRDGPFDDELPLFCQDCGGSTYRIAGCRECCRDCGRPCDHDKNAEGFHAEARS